MNYCTWASQNARSEPNELNYCTWTLENARSEPNELKYCTWTWQNARSEHSELKYCIWNLQNARSEPNELKYCTWTLQNARNEPNHVIVSFKCVICMLNLTIILKIIACWVLSKKLQIFCLIYDSWFLMILSRWPWYLNINMFLVS